MLPRCFASVAPGLFSRGALDLLDPDAAFTIFPVDGRPPDCRRKPCRCCRLDFEERFIGSNADRANLCPGDVTSPAQKRKKPPRIRIVAPTDIHPEPDGILKTRSWAVRALRGAGSRVDQFFGHGHACPVCPDQCGCNVLGTAFREKASREQTILLIHLNWLQQCREQSFAIISRDILAAWSGNPFGIDPSAAQHRFDALAPRIWHKDHCCTLFSCPAGAA